MAGRKIAIYGWALSICNWGERLDFLPNVGHYPYLALCVHI